MVNSRTAKISFDPSVLPLDLSVGYQNIEGIHHSQFGCKLPYLEKSFVHDIEIISETWGECSHDKNIPGYKKLKEVKPTKITHTKKGRASGGILTYVKTHLFDLVTECGQSDQYMWLEIEKSIFYDLKKPLLLCICYNPPSNSKYCNKDLYDEISIQLLKRSCIESPLMIIGDLNSRTGTLLDYDPEDEKHCEENLEIGNKRPTPASRQNCDKKANVMGQKLLNFCKAHDLQIVNGRTPGDEEGQLTFYDTQTGASAIDLAIVSDPIKPQIKSFIVCRQNEYSQHCKIVTRLKNIKNLPTKTKEKDYKWIPIDKKYVWADESLTKFRAELQSTNLQHYVHDCEQYLEAKLVEGAAGKLEGLFSTAADNVLEAKTFAQRRPTKHPFKHKAKKKKWFDVECTAARNTVRKLAGEKHSMPNDLLTRSKHSEALRKYKGICRQKKASFEFKQIEEISTLLKEPMTFWKKWKYMGDTQANQTFPDNIDGEKWEKYFGNLYTNKIKDEYDKPKKISQQDQNPALNTPFTMEEIDKAIDKKLHWGKAAGYDKNINEFLKAAPRCIRKVILKLMNTILETNIVPKSWCLGIISPIHKEGPKEDPDNYRGICIGYALSKLLSTMMNIRLTEFVEGSKLLHKNQIGFVTKCRTTDHHLTLKVLSKKYVSNEKGGKLYTCFVDFRKAFDTVWHNGLFHKLEDMNINGNFLLTLQNMYENTKCAVKLNNKLTQFFPCMQGVRQGDPLSPILFNLYINDIFKELKEAGCDPVYLKDGDPINGLAYADDLVLISRTREGLQKAIDTLSTFCEKWKLKVNLDKTKCMTFTKGTQKEKTIFTLNNQPIENVSEYKYLGMIINKKNCSFTPTIKYLRTKATRALYSLNSKLNIYRTPVKTALKIFDSLIRPILLYASEVFEPYSTFD